MLKTTPSSIIILATLFIFILLNSSKINATPITNVFINEIHYDNTGSDQHEFVELVGEAGINLLNWSLYFYNGSNGEVYKTFTFDHWLLFDENNGFGVATAEVSGIQNGSPDGIALADSDNKLIQFLSYEGTFTATTGIAAGLSSVDIGVSELTNTPVGFSLQLSGSGNSYNDFTWSEASLNTFGDINNHQNFISTPIETITVNEPSSIFILIIALLFLCIRNSYKQTFLISNLST
ncbi:hypothetical protein [Thalassotalea sp. PLHSN55]|uniref:hypothetical protein n=1 Tax=Thalassotalea sp. PLHSN55 TaxID=3435888 RepID=UPI003F86605D